MGGRFDFAGFLLVAAGLHMLALSVFEPRLGGLEGGGARGGRAIVTGASPEIAALIEAWNTPPEIGEAADLAAPAQEAAAPDASAAEVEAAVAAAKAAERLGAVSGPGSAPARPIFAPIPKTRTDAPAQLALRMPDAGSFAAPVLSEAGPAPSLDPPSPGGSGFGNTGLGGLSGGLSGGGLASPAPALSAPVSVYQPPEDDGFDEAEPEEPTGDPAAEDIQPEEEIVPDEAGIPDDGTLPEDTEPTSLAPPAAPLPRPRPERAALRTEPGPSAQRAPEPTRQERRADTAQDAPASSSEPGAAEESGTDTAAQADAGAPGAAGLPDGTRETLHRDYGHTVRAAIERHKRYPARARLMGVQGEVRLWLEIAPSGRLSGSRLDRPSGHAVLDDAAIEAARSAAPFPPAPHELGDGALSFIVPIRFKM